MATKAKILIVEDDRNTLSGMMEILKEEGYQVSGKASARKALGLLEQQPFDVLLTDLKMPEMSGMELYERSLTCAPDMKTVVMTAYSSVKDAVEAMKKGVYEYLTKPLDLDELFVILEKAIGEQNLQRENVELKKRVRSAYSFESMVGKSDAMQRVFRTIEKVAKTQSTVLVRGESGTGKELVARAIHYNSPRAAQPLIEISCPSFPESLLESELFGYKRGAFTGADSDKKGRFELAHNGTIFLDEIGEISENVQVKLLRVLQERQFSRLGDAQVRDVNVRVIAATNRDLEAAIKEGRFREDLYYRLNVIPIRLPALYERREDIPILLEHFVKTISMEIKVPPPTISEEVMQLCLSYDWPGNVRQLQNAIENAIVLGEGGTILPEHMPFGIHKGAITGNSPFLQVSGQTFKDKIEMAERIILQDAIDKANGNKSEAAKTLDISLRTMRYKIKKYAL